MLQPCATPCSTLKEANVYSSNNTALLEASSILTCHNFPLTPIFTHNPFRHTVYHKLSVHLERKHTSVYIPSIYPAQTNILSIQLLFILNLHFSISRTAATPSAQSNTEHPDRTLLNTYTTLLSWYGVQEIYCASVCNTTNVLESEAFFLWLPTNFSL